MMGRDIPEVKDFWKDGNWGFELIRKRSEVPSPKPTEEQQRDAIAAVAWEAFIYQSDEHEGPCCGSCDDEWINTNIGMRNFGFGCCCKTERYK